MYKTKGLIIGATLLTLVLVAGLACTTAIVTPSPNTTKSVIPNYLMYNDESGIFSIDYPADWEGGRWQKKSSPGQNPEEALKRLQSGLPIQYFSSLFFAGKRTQGKYEPHVVVILEPVSIGNPYYFTESAEKDFQDFRELPRINTTVNGREATILEWEGTPPKEQTALYYFELYVPTDKAVWVVSCGSNYENSAQWENDFDTIARSLKIYY